MGQVRLCTTTSHVTIQASDVTRPVPVSWLKTFVKSSASVALIVSFVFVPFENSIENLSIVRLFLHFFLCMENKTNGNVTVNVKMFLNTSLVFIYQYDFIVVLCVLLLIAGYIVLPPTCKMLMNLHDVCRNYYYIFD